MREKLSQYNKHPVQYEEGLTVARRIRASRYLGTFSSDFILSDVRANNDTECSAKHNRGVSEVFLEATRVSIAARASGGSREEEERSCTVM